MHGSHRTLILAPTLIVALGAVSDLRADFAPSRTFRFPPEQATISQGLPAITSSEDRYLVAWTEGDGSVRFSVFLHTGALIAERVVVPGLTSDERTELAAGSNGEDFMIVCSNEPGYNGIRVQATRVSGSRGILDQEASLLDQKEDMAFRWASQGEPAIASDGEDYFVVWKKHLRGDSTYALRGAMIRSSGSVQIISEPVAHSTMGTGRPSVAWSGEEYTVAWGMPTELPGGTCIPTLVPQFEERAENIFSRRVTSQGAFPDSAPIRVTTEAADHHQPALVGSNGELMLAYAWDDCQVGQIRVRLDGASGAALEATLVEEAEPGSEPGAFGLAAVKVGSRGFVFWTRGRNDVYGVTFALSDPSHTAVIFPVAADPATIEASPSAASTRNTMAVAYGRQAEDDPARIEVKLFHFASRSRPITNVQSSSSTKTRGENQ